MSELKAILATPHPKMKNACDGAIEVYLKSQADKVIAEKDAKILALDAEVAKQKHHAKLFFDERNYAETQLRHSNHKRCLAMAKCCEERYRYLTCLENWQMTDKEYQQVIGDYWDKWYKRWLALAEEPTWTKFLQLIHREAK